MATVNLSSIITPANVLTASNAETLTNKTISGASNTLTNVPLTTGVTGTLPVANGGTGLSSTPSNGQLDIGNSTGFTRATITAGSGISVTNGSGSITIASTASGLSGQTDSASPFETSLGFGAGNVNTSLNSTFIGYEAGLLSTTGDNNTALGSRALKANTTGNFQTAIGHLSLTTNTTSFGNTAAGYGALRFVTTGGNNVGIGLASGEALTTGAGNIAIGGVTAAGSVSPAFAISTQNNYISMGSTAVTNAYIQVAWTVLSDARDKMNFAPVLHGLDFVKQLNPVQYQFKINRDSDVPHGPVRYGFKAQDILALEGNNSVIIDSKNKEKLYYNGESLVPVLVKALQELSAKFDAYVATHP